MSFDFQRLKSSPKNADLLPEFVGPILSLGQNQNSVFLYQNKNFKLHCSAIFNKVKIEVVALAQRSLVGTTKSAIEVFGLGQKVSKIEKKVHLEVFCFGRKI